MKNSTFFYLCFLSVVLLSCKDDAPTVSPETDITIEIYAWYDTETSSRLLPDINSRAFLYYDIDAETIRHSGMNNNGILTNGTSVIQPDLSVHADQDGKAIILLPGQNKEREFSILVYCNFYQRYTIESYPWGVSASFRFTIINNE